MMKSTDEIAMETHYLLPEVDDEITKITIENGTNKISMAAVSEGEWQIKVPFRAFADVGKVAKMLDTLGRLKREEVITGAQRAMRELSLADYGLEESQYLLTLESNAKGRTILVGKKSPFNDLVYVRIKGESDVIATSIELLNILPRDVESIQDFSLLRGDISTTTALEIQSKRFGFIQIAKVNEEWRIVQPFSSKADAMKIQNLLSTLYAAKIVRFYSKTVPEQTDLNKDASIRTVTGVDITEDNAEVKISVQNSRWNGAKNIYFGSLLDNSSDLVYVRIKGTDPIGLVNKQVRDVFNVPIDDLRDFCVFAFNPKEIRQVKFKKQQSILVLARDDDIGWIIKEPVLWRADNLLVENILNKLAGIRVTAISGNLLTNTMAYSAFQKPVFEIFISSKIYQDSDKGYFNQPGGRLLSVTEKNEAHQYWVKFNNEDFFYDLPLEEINFLPPKLTDPITYRNKTVLSINPETLVGISVKKANVEQKVRKKKDGGWESLSENKRVNIKAIDDLLLMIANLTVLRFESFGEERLEKYGLDNPFVVLSFYMDETAGIQKSLWLGYKAGVEGVFGMIKGDDAIFVVDNDTVTRLIKDICGE